MAKDHYLTAQEATEELGVSAATLYAYVSRGLIRSEPVDGKKRVRRYHGEDVQRLRERKELRRNPAKLAEQALHWGVPVLDAGSHAHRRGSGSLDLARRSRRRRENSLRRSRHPSPLLGRTSTFV